MKTAIDKNETEVQKMKREALEWMEQDRNKKAPPFILIAINAFPEPTQMPTGILGFDVLKYNSDIAYKQTIDNIKEEFPSRLSDVPDFEKFSLLKESESITSTGTTYVPEVKASDLEIIKYMEDNCRNEDGSPMMDEQTFYEGAKAMRDGKIGTPKEPVTDECDHDRTYSEIDGFAYCKKCGHVMQ